MKRIIGSLFSIAIAFLLLVGFHAGTALAFTNHCVPQSACSALPGDCPSGNSATYNFGGGTAAAGACGAGNRASAAGERSGFALAGSFSGVSTVNASAVASGAGAQVSTNVDVSGTLTGTASFTSGGIVSITDVQGNNDIRVSLYGSTALGAASGSFSVDQAGNVSLSCSGVVSITVAYFGRPTICVGGVVH